MFYILEIIIFTINDFVQKINNYIFEIYTRLFLRNQIDETIINFINDAKKQFNKEKLIIDDLNSLIIYNKDKNIRSIILEVFLIDKNQNNFNVKENLYIIKGFQINNLNTITDFKLKNSDDLGEIVPENTNKYFF